MSWKLRLCSPLATCTPILPSRLIVPLMPQTRHAAFYRAHIALVSNAGIGFQHQRTEVSLRVRKSTCAPGFGTSASRCSCPSGGTMIATISNDSVH